MEREAAEVYAAVRPSGHEPAWAAPIPELRPTLRPYQARALAWMLRRERLDQVQFVSHWLYVAFSRAFSRCTLPLLACDRLSCSTATRCATSRCSFPQAKQEAGQQQQLHPLWREVATPRGAFWLQPAFGLVSARPFPPPPPVPAGILADEMVCGGLIGGIRAWCQVHEDVTDVQLMHTRLH